MRRTSEVIRGLAALVLLVALVVAVPIGLVHFVRWPLPSHLPSGRQISDAITRDGVADRTIVKLVACVLWFAWIQLAVSVIVEAVSLARHRSVPHLRGLGPLRHVAASLVAAITVLFTSVAILVPAAGAKTAATVVVRADGAPASARSAGGTEPIAPLAAPTAPAEPTPLPAFTVRPRDTMWGIAEHALGRGERWVEIQQLNVGREVAHGVRFTAHTELIRPGWRLLLPADAAVTRGAADGLVAPEVDATAATAATAASSNATSTTVVVRRGDTLSRIAERVYGDPGQWRSIWQANRGTSFGAHRFDDPNVILAGWTLTVPAGSSATSSAVVPPTSPVPPSAPVVVPPAPATVVPPAPTIIITTTTTTAPPAPAPALDPRVVTSPPVVSPAVATSPALTPPSPPPSAPAAVDGGPGAATALPTPGLARPDAAPTMHPAVDDERPAWVAATGIAGVTLLATGVAGMVTSRRRRRLRSMGRDEALPFPDPDLAPVDTAVRVGADAVTMARIDVALRSLANSVGRPPEGRGQRPVVVLRQPNGDLEVVLSHPVGSMVPSPWIAGADARRVVLPASVATSVVAETATGSAAPCPALVMLGRCDEAEVYLDLEAAGIVAIDGPPAIARSLARAVMACLAVTPLADVLTVVTSGFDCYGLGDESRVRPVDEPGPAVELVGSLSRGVRDALLASGAASTFALRVAEPQEPWEPVVLVTAGVAVVADTAARLGELVSSGGVAVVTDQPWVDAPWRVAMVPGGHWRLEPLGLDITPSGLSEDELADIGALLSDADAPAVRVEPRPAPSVVVGSNFDEPPWTLMARLLGPIAVVDRDGAAADFERSKALELVVWLAQHRANPTRTAARTALWEVDVRDATFANVVSDARRAMARLVAPPDGQEWVARNQGERIPLHRLVITDADLLAAQLDHARQQPAGEAVITLRAALEQVHDLPYAGTNYLWPDGQGLPSQLILLVTNAAIEMAERCLDTDDADGVFWATGQGLKVLAGHDELVCLRMRAHAHRGNLAGVRNEFESYERVVVGDPWGDGEPSPKVVALRNELMSPSSR